jgi:hypothetical protein
VRDVLIASSRKNKVRYSNEVQHGSNGLVKNAGDTSLGEGLIALLEEKPDAVFVITDGYENAPSGRLNEIIRLARKVGIETPVFQITPVMAAESSGVRRLSDGVGLLPVSKPEALGTTMIRGLFEVDLEKAINALLSATLPMLNE